MAEPEQHEPDSARLIEITLDQDSIGSANADIEHERQVAIFDLIEENRFALQNGQEGPYKLDLAITEGRLAFSVGNADGQGIAQFLLSLQPFRRLIKDYFLICDSYYQSIKSAPTSRIEAIDMGRRALHDEGSKLLLERLQGKIETDLPTARRLFTLICALHWKG